MKKISVLGCGWLGMPLGETLVKLGFSVNGSTTKKEKLNTIQSYGINPFLIDLNKLANHPKDFFNSDILIITIPPGNVNIPEEYFLQLEKILGLAKNGKVKNILFISSTSVYPTLNREVFEEDESEQALTRSGVSLLKAEQIFKSANNTIIRFSGLIGNDRHPGKWFAGKCDLKGGNMPVNMIHQVDCINIIQTIISGHYWAETFNASAEEHPLKKEYYTKLSKGLGLNPPQFDEEDSSNWKIVSSKYLKDKTGYIFKQSIYNI